MTQTKIFQITLIVAILSLPLSLLAEYTDHRNRNVDSLEHVLQTQHPKGEQLARIYRGLMAGYQQTDAGRSTHYAKLLIELAEKNKYYNSLYQAWLMVGVQAYARCEYDSAKRSFDRALAATDKMTSDKRYTQLDLDNNYSQLYGSLGNLYNIQGKAHLAIDYYQKALPIFKRNGWRESESILYFNVGELYLELGNNDAAEENYQKALDLALQTGDSLVASGPYCGLAYTMHNAGKDDRALEYALRGRAYYAAHADEEMEGLLDNDVLLSKIYLLGYKDLEAAQRHMDHALLLAERADAPTNLSDAYAQQAAICLERCEWTNTIAWAQKALETNDQDPQHNIGIYKTMAEAYASMGNTNETRRYVNLLFDTMEEQSTTKYQSTLSEMEVRYQTLEKEALLRDLEQRHHMARLQNWAYLALIVILVIAVIFIILMNRQQRRISNMMSRMQGEADERTRLGRDLHDRLGGLLTSIHMQTNEEPIRTLSEQATEEMRRVAHHLMPASLQEKGLATALRDFCRVNPIVSFAHHGQDLRLPEQQEVIMYCATHELVNNALKHAEASHIMVELMIDEEYAAVIVSDNGKGFDPDSVTKNMGLHNIRERIELQQGRMNICSSATTGTEINIEIPR